MGAQPRWALLSLSLPTGDEGWVTAFIEGFMGLAGAHGVQLVGGDTCAGPLSVTVTALGVVAAGRALSRGGARPGDLVVVSGRPGRAGLALAQLRAGKSPDHEDARALLQPLPRVALGQALVGVASACIDLSDGLLADLGHVAEASACAAVIELAALPVEGPLRECPQPERWDLQLTAGDDYELCFTLPPQLRPALAGLEDRSGLPLSVVGRMEQGSGLRCIAPDGQVYDPGRGGYDHFA
jgi:thiamine-monophosphate kinase